MLPRSDHLEASATKDPFDYHEPGSSQTIEFYAYGAELSKLEASSCFRKALYSAITQHGSAPTLMGTEAIMYPSTSDHVFLTLVPRDTMTWRMWSEALLGLMDFLLTHEGREWQFLILEEGLEGEVGYGAICQRPEASE